MDELGDRERDIEMAMDMARVPQRLGVVRPERSRWGRWLGSISKGAVEVVGMESEQRLQSRMW